MFLSLTVMLVLLALRIWAPPVVHADVAEPYATLVIHTIGVSLLIAIAVFVDRLVRFFYWDGYLRRRRKQETPALVEDIVTVVLVVIGASIGFTFEAGMSLSGILTASGATAIVIGIALQTVIQDLFSGLSINFDRSYAIGDWLTIYCEHFPEPIYGRVAGITWRITYLRLENGRRLMVPNRFVTSNPVLNHSRPEGGKRLSVEISVDNRIPPERAMSILLGEAYKAVRNPGLVRIPDPTIVLKKLTDDAAIYEVRFYADPDEIEPGLAQSIVLEALLLATLRHRLPMPVQQVELTPPPTVEREFDEQEVRDALSDVDLLDVLNEKQLHKLVRACKHVKFPGDVTFIRQGEQASSMFVILEGAARVSIAGPAGARQEVAVLTAGDIVGEMSLMTGAPRTATVTAITPLHVLEVTKEPIEVLLKDSPELLERFGRVLAQRQLELSQIANQPVKEEEIEIDLLERMRAFFSRVFWPGESPS